MSKAVLTGDWAAVKKGLRSKAQRKQIPILQKRMTALGKAVVSQLKQHIIRQDIDWVPLSSSTIARKGHSKIYVETLDYLNSLKTKTTKIDADTIELDVYPDGVHRSSGLPMEILAAYLEYGTTKIPVRPLWRPTFFQIPSMPAFHRLRATIVEGGFVQR